MQIEQRTNMVRNQVRAIGIDNNDIMNAMLTIPRHEFVEKKFSAVAYSDAELPVTDKKIIARPEMIAKLLAAAEITYQDRVLEIGCSTGYATMIIAQIAQHVVGVDNCRKSINKAKKLTAELNNIEFHYQNLLKISEIFDCNLVIVNGAIFSRDPGDISHLQDPNDLFDIRAKSIIDNLPSECRIVAVEGYYKYAPMHIVQYYKGSRQILDEIYMPELIV